MVAPTATTRPPEQPHTLRASTPSTPTSPLSIPAHLAASILDDLASPKHSLLSVASKHDLSVDALIAWLALPETRERMATRESAGLTHARYVSSMNLASAVHTLVTILRIHNTTAPHADPSDATEPTTLRASIHARKAAWLLYRFSRLTPVSGKDLTHARHILSEHTEPSSSAEESAPDRSAITCRETPSDAKPYADVVNSSHDGDDLSSPTPSQTLCVSPTETSVQDASPASIEDAASPSDDAESTVSTEVSEAEPASAPDEAHASNTDAEPTPEAEGSSDDLESLIAHLSSIATSLGIDISDIDELALAGPPPGGPTRASDERTISQPRDTT